MRETHDNCLSISDNFDTQRLYVKVNHREDSTPFPLDRTVTQLLHNRQNADEVMANLAFDHMDLTRSALSDAERPFAAALDKDLDTVLCTLHSNPAWFRFINALPQPSNRTASFHLSQQHRQNGMPRSSRTSLTICTVMGPHSPSRC